MVEGIRFDVSGRVASVVFDRPDRMNLLTSDILRALGEIATTLAASPDIDVLTLTGEGTEFFSTGILTPALRGSLTGAPTPGNPPHFASGDDHLTWSPAILISQASANSTAPARTRPFRPAITI